MHIKTHSQQWKVIVLTAVLFLAGWQLCACQVSALAATSGSASTAVGWVVGWATDGYGLILHTTDGGVHWMRQGTPEQIPDLNAIDIYAVDGDCAWIVGEAGLILHTEDGGHTWVRQGRGWCRQWICRGSMSEIASTSGRSVYKAALAASSSTAPMAVPIGGDLPIPPGRA